MHAGGRIGREGGRGWLVDFGSIDFSSGCFSFNLDQGGLTSAFLPVAYIFLVQILRGIYFGNSIL